MIGPVKAKFKIVSSAQKLLDANVEVGGQSIPCIFNPTEFTIQRSVNYAQHKIPGLERPALQYVSGEAEVMTFSLLFDTYSAGDNSNDIKVALSAAAPDAAKADVRNYTDPIMKLTTINPDVHAPDLVQFVWGKMIYRGYINSLSQKFTLFTYFGKPVRAVVDVSIIIDKNKYDSKVRNSPDRTKARTVKESDKLYMFALSEYGSCDEWRRIAEANDIDDPRRLEAGSNIIIPPIL